MSMDLAKLMGGRLQQLGQGERAREEARAIADQFEDVMVRTFVGSLRQTTSIGAESGGMFGDGPGADTYADWFDEKLAHELSASGRVGVADVLMQEFERWKQIPAAATPPPTKAAAHAPTNLLDVDRRLLHGSRLPTLTAGSLPGGGLDVAA